MGRHAGLLVVRVRARPPRGEAADTTPFPEAVSQRRDPADRTAGSRPRVAAGRDRTRSGLFSPTAAGGKPPGDALPVCADRFCTTGKKAARGPLSRSGAPSRRA